MSALDLVAIFVLLGLNGFFVGSEFALISARRTQIEPLAAHSRRARAVVAAMEAVPTMLAGAQLGVTVASLLLGAIGEPTLAHALEPAFEAASVPEHFVHPVAFALALTLVVSGHIMLGEMVPKNLALAGPERVALWIVPPLLAFSRLTQPFIAVIKLLSNVTLRLMRLPATSEVRTVYTRDELPALIGESREHRLLEAAEHDRMIATLALHARPVEGVMVPLSKVVTVSAATTPVELQDFAGKYGHSRFPVHGDEPGELRGYLHILDALNGAPRERPLPVRVLPTVAGGAMLADVLALMRKSRAQVVAVAGRDGATVGVATLDDVLVALLQPAD
ncbi:hemolysin family protein [Actinomadura alba]|uniref:HlyC/CorC family transporter n=1 Tax=Actinomadura alba TaxID=406431 RepID=A0ABR7LHY9_9ACTN|nr:hemolysin family protein [Actinomadura alba]MBC6464379.1 HlyC/CorC family transporter [Actinomadura alba]